MVQFCTKQIESGSLSAEALSAELKTKILPQCYEELKAESGENEIFPYEELLAMNDLKNVSTPTAWRWMKYLGFNYNETKKCYYTDGHDRKDVVNTN